MTEGRPTGFAAYRRVGGHPALDLVNTVGWRGSDHPDELLLGVDDLDAWVASVELPVARSPASGRARWDDAGLEQVRDVREALHRVFQPIALGSDPSPDDVDDLVTRYVRALGSGKPSLGDAGLRWHWPQAPASDLLVNEVLVRAVELLDSDMSRRVKLCTDDTCGWLFLDRSKNASRRWCSMEICGSRTKMRRHYQRKKERSER